MAFKTIIFDLSEILQKVTENFFKIVTFISFNKEFIQPWYWISLIYYTAFARYSEVFL